MELNHTAMKALLEAFDRSDWQEMTVTVGDDRLHVSRQASSNGAADAEVSGASSTPPAPASVPAPAAEAEPAVAAPSSEPSATTAPVPAPSATDGTVVESPSVGLFWRAPAPNEPPFVEAGTRVEVGDTLAIVEVMKLMNHVTAPVAGIVTAILAENGATVEYGQALLTIDTEG